MNSKIRFILSSCVKNTTRKDNLKDKIRVRFLIEPALIFYVSIVLFCVDLSLSAVYNVEKIRLGCEKIEKSSYSFSRNGARRSGTRFNRAS